MPTVKIGGINMYYEIHGEGEPLVMINGVGGNVTRWFRNIEALSRRYRVIAFDNRGMGRTDRPGPPYSIEMMATDTAGLMESLGIEKAHLFGHSMGGAIAQCFALRYPAKLHCLMLGSTLAGGANTAWGKFDPPPQGTETGQSPEEEVRQGIASAFSRRFFEDNRDIIDEIVKVHLQYPIDPKGFSLQWDAAVAHDVYDHLPEITLPTLVIHGSEDRILLEENAHLIASRIPGAKLAIMDGVGHNIYSEAPEELHRILFDFMRQHAPKAA